VCVGVCHLRDGTPESNRPFPLVERIDTQLQEGFRTSPRGFAHCVPGVDGREFEQIVIKNIEERTCIETKHQPLPPSAKASGEMLLQSRMRRPEKNLRLSDSYHSRGMRSIRHLLSADSLMGA